MIKIRDLEYLQAVSHYKHFGKAAEFCHVSQPTLSGQLIKLEQQLGLQLFERHRKGVLLTPAGKTLSEKAQRVLNTAIDFEDTARELTDPLSGELHIGLIPTLAPYLLPRILEPIKANLPNIDLFLYEQQTSDLLEELDQGILDVLILPWLEDMDQVERYSLFDEPLVLMAPTAHPLHKQVSLSLSDLRGEELFTLEDGHCLRDQALGFCFAAGASENTQFRATSLETLRHMVISGMGLTLMPELATAGRQDGASVTYRQFDDPKPYRNISLLVRPNFSRMACIREVVAAIRQEFSD